MNKLKKIDEAWLKIDVDEKDLFNPTSMLNSSDEDFHLKLTWLMTRPEYFSFLVKQIFNIQLLPSQALILYELWNRKFPMLIASRGFGKSFMLSLYCMLRALILPGRKVVVVGAAFRQSKVLFEYMETIWNNSPILRDICDGNSGPRRDVDRCVMRINDSRVTCLPLGDGQKIRGQRANDIISDEFVQRQIKAKPGIEEKRIANETKKRGKGKMQEKVSPYHAVDKDFSLEKIALQTGVASPSQVGLKLDPKSPDEKTGLEMRSKPKPTEPKIEDNTSPGEPGRPKNSTDEMPRERRTFKPAIKATTELWAKKAQAKISKTVNPIILGRFDKKNMRSLSSEQTQEAEKIKFEILCSLEPNSKVDQMSIAKAIKSWLKQKGIHN